MRDYKPTNNRYWVAYNDGSQGGGTYALRTPPYFEVKDRVSGATTNLYTTKDRLSLCVWDYGDETVVLDLEQIAEAFRAAGKDPIVKPLTCEDVHKFFLGGNISLRLNKEERRQ